MSNIDKIIQLAKKGNTLLSYNELKVPVLDEFTVVQQDLDNPNNNVMFVALRNNVLEQFLGDGALLEDESFEKHLESVIDSMKETVKDNPLYEGNDNYLIPYENYDNDMFDFKIYAQDILMGTKDNIKFVRQLSAFFLEPRSNEFFQISMSAGQYSESEYKLLKDIKDFQNDEILKGLEQNLKLVLDNLTYIE